MLMSHKCIGFTLLPLILKAERNTESTAKDFSAAVTPRKPTMQAQH
jgi:hypothetical protein